MKNLKIWKKKSWELKSGLTMQEAVHESWDEMDKSESLSVGESACRAGTRDKFEWAREGTERIGERT